MLPEPSFTTCLTTALPVMGNTAEVVHPGTTASAGSDNASGATTTTGTSMSILGPGSTHRDAHLINQLSTTHSLSQFGLNPSDRSLSWPMRHCRPRSSRFDHRYHRDRHDCLWHCGT